QMGGVSVHRFHYAPAALERLAYRGGLLARAATPAGAALVVPFLGAFAVAAARAGRRLRPDVIHAHWWFPGGVVALPAARASGPPLVVHLHGTDVHLAERGGLRALARAVLGRAAVVATVSDALRDAVVRDL